MWSVSVLMFKKTVLFLCVNNSCCREAYVAADIFFRNIKDIQGVSLLDQDLGRACGSEGETLLSL